MKTFVVYASIHYQNTEKVAKVMAEVLILIFGFSFFYLTWCVQKATRLYPPQETKNSAREQMTSENPHSQAGLSLFREASLSLTDAFSLFRGVLITFIGLLYYGCIFWRNPIKPERSA